MLTVRGIPFREACEFVNTHHEHHVAPQGHKFSLGAFYENELVGVAIVGRPVARALDDKQTLEITRLCINHDVPPERTRNAVSKLIGRVRAEARKRDCLRLITYTLESEGGGLLRAAGFEYDAKIRGKSWNTPKRVRVDKHPTVDKVRWITHIKPRLLRKRDEESSIVNPVHQITIDPEFRDLLPPLREDERLQLEENVKARGVNNPLHTWRGILIDGHHRLEICTRLGIPYTVTEHEEITSRAEAIVWMLQNQIGQRNLTDHWRGVAALRMKSALAEQAELRKLEALKGDASVRPNSDAREIARTDEVLAKIAHMGKTKLREIEAIERDAPPPLVAAARAGEMATHRAYELTTRLKQLPEPVRAVAAELCADSVDKADTLLRLYRSSEGETSNDTFSEILASGGFAYGAEMALRCEFAEATPREIDAALKDLAVQHKVIARKAQLAELEAQIASQNIVAPDGLFEVIVVDPPWQYGGSYDPEGWRNAAPYPEMSLEQIAALQLPAAQDCVLWLWTTHKFMRHAYPILDAWGFEEKRIVTWVKNKFALGRWLQSNSEFCLMAVRGNPKVDLSNQNTVIYAPVREHSRKPDEFYDLVNSLCIGRKLDYFGREGRNGWVVYGAEADKFEGAA